MFCYVIEREKEIEREEMQEREKREGARHALPYVIGERRKQKLSQVIRRDREQ